MIGAFSVSLQESMSQEDGLANDAGELALWRTKYKKTRIPPVKRGEKKSGE